MIKKSCKCKCKKTSKRDRRTEEGLQKMLAEAKINAEFTSDQIIGLAPMSQSQIDRYNKLREIQRTGKGNL